MAVFAPMVGLGQAICKQNYAPISGVLENVVPIAVMPILGAMAFVLYGLPALSLASGPGLARVASGMAGETLT